MDKIKKRTDFLSTYKGFCVRNKAFSVFILKNKFGKNRVGITAPRTVGSAVMRNRLKRWVREIYRQNELPAVGFDLHVVLGNKKVPFDFKDMKFQVFKDELEVAIAKAFRAVKKSIS